MLQQVEWEDSQLKLYQDMKWPFPPSQDLDYLQDDESSNCVAEKLS